MSANIYEKKMFCVGKAWHEEGIRVEKELLSKEAIKVAQLDYQIKKTPLYTEVNGQKIETGILGTLNTENNKILGTVKDRYKIIQNTEAFDFFDNVVKSGEAFYHSAGALGNGERIWILAKLPNNILLFKDDIIEKYLLLTNSHDGKHSLAMYFTPIRVVCQNTLIASLKDYKNGIHIRHTGNIKSKVNEARRTLGLALDFYNTFEENTHKLLDTKMSLEGARGYFNDLLKIEEEKEISTQTKNARDTLLYLFRKGKGNTGDNLWSGYNAITEYVDHYKTSRGKGNRTKSILFGSGAKLKERAYNKVLALVK